MIILIVFAFLAGVVTILSPCILPVLPIILSSVGTTSKSRPIGVVLGFVLSFTFFTLFLSSLVRLTGIPADTFRLLSIGILFIGGLSFLIPKIQIALEQTLSRLTQLAPKQTQRTGIVGGLVIGFSLGLLWTPCVGPILASVISLALTGTVSAQAAVITLAYALGTAIPMFLVMVAGSTALQKVPWLVKQTAAIQKTFGILMVVTAIGIFFNIDRRFQIFILDTFPQYGLGLTKIEDSAVVKTQLHRLNSNSVDEDMLGKPMDITDKTQYPPAPEIIPGGAWFNSPPLQLSELRGKVILVDFWTYSCINCIRTLPYLRSWWETYQDDGLVIIGVHSPEFEFEKNESNVANAIEDFGLLYPIVQDNNFATWRAYGNRYWPAKYLIDKDGRVRYYHFGEGAYDETEQMIQKLLEETGVTELPTTINNPTYQIYSRTPETYLGYDRIANFASLEKILPNQVSTYTSPGALEPNQVSYHGQWSIGAEYANPQAGAILQLNFESKEVYLVMRTKGSPSTVRVTVDGVQQYEGPDVTNGVVTVTKDTLYRIVTLPEPGRHLLRLEFLDNDTEIYAFTFG